MHVRVMGPNGEAKYWIEPTIGLARNFRLAPAEIAETLRLVQEHEDEIRRAWQRHFGS